jgi:hypothetical protein
MHPIIPVVIKNGCQLKGDLHLPLGLVAAKYPTPNEYTTKALTKILYVVEDGFDCSTGTRTNKQTNKQQHEDCYTW